MQKNKSASSKKQKQVWFFTLVPTDISTQSTNTSRYRVNTGTSRRQLRLNWRVLFQSQTSKNYPHSASSSSAHITHYTKPHLRKQKIIIIIIIIIQLVILVYILYLFKVKKKRWLLTFKLNTAGTYQWVTSRFSE